MTLDISMEEACLLKAHLDGAYQYKKLVPDFYAELDNEIQNESEAAHERFVEGFYGGDGPDVAYRAQMKDAGRGHLLP